MKSIKDINFAGKKVLLRVDFNVPMNDKKEITDDTRMRESMPTIEKLLKDGAAVIIMAHFGRPKKGGFEPELTLEPVAKYLETLVGRPVKFTQELLGSGKPEQMAKERRLRCRPPRALLHGRHRQVLPQRQVLRLPDGERGAQP